MNLLKKPVILSSLFLLCVSTHWLRPLFALEDNDFSQLSFQIYQNKEMFSSRDAIHVYGKITNNGDSPVLIKFVAIFHTSFRLALRDPQGINIPLKVKWILEGKNWSEAINSASSDAYEKVSKSILLASGESFTKKINLQNMYDFFPEKDYIIQGYFYPDFIGKQNIVIKSSNWIRFQTEKIYEKQFSEEYTRAFSEESGPQISPDETVFLHLKAEIEKIPVRFLKYIHLAEYIQLFDRFVTGYNESVGLKKQKILNLFKRFLTRKRHDYLVDFKIKKAAYSNINKKKAYVYVQVERFGEIRPFYFEYVYTLKPIKKQQGWLITHLKVIRKKDKLD